MRRHKVRRFSAITSSSDDVDTVSLKIMMVWSDLRALSTLVVAPVCE